MPALAIRCELLCGVYQAADPFGGSEDAEWPPHPFRLHAALVAAACELGGEEPDREHVEALDWLERQGAPAITHSAASRRGSPLAYVPRNPMRVEFARAREQSRKNDRFVSPWQRNGRRFPAAVPEHPVLTYQWPEVADLPDALSQLTSGVSWLGSSRSPVGCALVDSPPPATLVPAGSGDRSLRVAGPGVTGALLDARHQWPTPVEAPLMTYAPRTPHVASDAASSPAAVFGTLLVKRLERPRLDLRFAGALCAAVRLAVLAQAGDAAPAQLHGHGDAKHAAYLALGDIGRKHATGAIAGVALALPGVIENEAHDACAAAFSAVDRVNLGAGMRTVGLTDELGTAMALRPERWIGPASSFATATPVILDRFPRRGRTVEDELRRSIVNAGFPEPEGVRILAGPAVLGGVLTTDLRGDLPPGRRVHARVDFSTPIRGPLAAGRGRFRGVGLFVPTYDRS